MQRQTDQQKSILQAGKTCGHGECARLQIPGKMQQSNSTNLQDSNELREIHLTHWEISVFWLFSTCELGLFSNAYRGDE
jgi:hypothetical protein